MDSTSVDLAIECVAFLAVLMGPPDGPEVAEDHTTRRWVWSEADNENPAVLLVLGEHEDECYVEIDLDETGGGHPRYYTIVGWCALHAMPCLISLAGHQMEVAARPHEGQTAN